MTTNTEQGGETRAKILATAARLFAMHGLAGASVRDICREAGANVAAVNYYFRSKEGLYREVFEMVFADAVRPLTGLPASVRDERTWKAALHAWILTVLEFSTRDDPPFVWASQLFAHERICPTAMFPLLHERVFQPIRGALSELLRMALPRAREEEIHMWVTCIYTQVTPYVHRRPPWDELIFPKGLDRVEWQQWMARHILAGVTSRVHYRGPAKPVRARRSAE